MRLNRNFVTPLITVVFLIVALSGILMFFHLFDGYTEVVHEILGLVFVVFSVFHIILNWKALKIHFRKRFFISATITVAAISLLLIVQQYNNPKLDAILLEKITNAPIGDVLKVLQVDSTEAVKRLEANGISYDGAVTMEEIWTNNKIHPKIVFDLIME
jgi:phosphate starvation-inducible membrane PsiE